MVFLCVKRKKGFEPSTLALARLYSTIELFPRFFETFCAYLLSKETICHWIMQNERESISQMMEED